MIAIEQRVLIENTPKAVEERLLKETSARKKGRTLYLNSCRKWPKHSVEICEKDLQQGGQC